MKKLLVALLALAVSNVVHAQSVQQSGSVTSGHAAMWVSNGVIKDGGTAASGNLTSLGVTNNGGPGVCVNSGPITGPYQQLCLSASTTGSGVISLQNYGGATAQPLIFDINGTSFPVSSALSLAVGTTPVTNGSVGLPLSISGNKLSQVSRSGTTSTYASTSGALSNGHCVSIDGLGNLVDAGGACTTGGGGGTITAAAANDVPYYTGTTTVSGGPFFTFSSSQVSISNSSTGAIGHSRLSNGQTGGLAVSAIDPLYNGSHGDAVGITFYCDVNTGFNVTPLFTDNDCFNKDFTVRRGQNSYGGTVLAKRTFIEDRNNMLSIAAGQRIVQAASQTCQGMGDCNLFNWQLYYANADINGDEGTGFSAGQSLMSQQTFLQNTAIISSVPTQTLCNTTLTQAITGSNIAQTVTVADSTNCNAGDWIVVNNNNNYAAMEMEAVQLTAVAPGSITGIFMNKALNGWTITPAVKLQIDSGMNQWGEQRTVVNLSQPAYTTGTVSAIPINPGNQFTGTGVTWSSSMVGGSSTLPGCVELDSDTYTGAPFNGTGTQGPLKSWYQIQSIDSTTQLSMFSLSVAGDRGYHGIGVKNGPTTYAIRPCAILLQTYLPQTGPEAGHIYAILNTNSFTWTTGDNLELAIAPYPDLSPLVFRIGQWSPGGTRRSFLDMANTGARTFQQGIFLRSIMATAPNADTAAFQTGIIVNSAQTGISIQDDGPTAQRAILLNAPPSYVNDNWSKISFNDNAYIRLNSASFSLLIAGTGDVLGGTKGNILFTPPATIGSGSRVAAVFDGMYAGVPGPYAALPTCAAGTEGYGANVSDSRSRSLGATITGGGIYHIKAYCNGTSWIVESAAEACTTVSGLGTYTPQQGNRWCVTDGNAGLAWGATAVGGGTTPYLVWYNGTNWTVSGK